MRETLIIAWMLVIIYVCRSYSLLLLQYFNNPASKASSHSCRGNFLAMGGGAVRGDRIPSLIAAISPSSLPSSQIISLIAEIADQNRAYMVNNKRRVESMLLDGRWKLLWTDDDSWRGSLSSTTSSIDIVQTIDLGRCKLTLSSNRANVIEYDILKSKQNSSLPAISIRRLASGSSKSWTQWFQANRIEDEFVEILYINNKFRLDRTKKQKYYVFSR
jgi:hypothetical protein